MKKIKLITVLFLVIITYSCKAQVLPLENIIPVEEEILYRNNDAGFPDGTYFKDVNNLFDKYLGTWVGVHDGKSYELMISKYIYNSTIRPLKRDELIIRYKVIDADGSVLINALGVSDDSLSVIEGDYLDENGETYHLDYMGENSVCGQNGYILVAVVDGGLKMNFSYSIRGETTSACTTGPAQQVFPSTMQLDKQ